MGRDAVRTVLPLGGSVARSVGSGVLIDGGVRGGRRLPVQALDKPRPSSRALSAPHRIGATGGVIANQGLVILSGGNEAG